MSRVRGPNSALTEFLRSQGIDANEIRRRHEKRLAEDDAAEETTAEDQLEPESETTDEEDDEVTKIAYAAARKREDADKEGTSVCPSCHSRFTITVFSKQVDGTKDQFLCRTCSIAPKKKTSRPASKANTKKRKKMAEDLLDLKFRTPPSLQDLCITFAAEHIESVTELGSLSAPVFLKISRILTKNRRLSPKTMQLFLQPQVTELEFWDCSSITPESFNLIPALCSNLESLVLGMCGQLTGDNLLRIAKLKSMKKLHLDGPFMVRKDAWLDFFETMGERLEEFSVSSVYRIDAEVLAVMASSCVGLKSLKLQSLCQLRDQAPFFLLSSLQNLRKLEISDLEPEAWSDDALVEVLNMVGSQLESLVIRNALDNLSDRVVDVISETCGRLTNLELVNLTAISTEAVASMFQHWTEVKSNRGLKTLSLERCVDVADEAVAAAIDHSGSTLQELSINSLRHTKPATIERFAKLPVLTKLDIGFVGQVNPRQIYILSTSKSLRQVFAFGNIRISGMPLPTGVQLLGTM